MIPIQLDLFDPIDTPEDLLRKQVETVFERQENLRRGLFARLGEVMKILNKQNEVIEKQNQEIEKLREMMVKIR